MAGAFAALASEPISRLGNSSQRVRAEQPNEVNVSIEKRAAGRAEPFGPRHRYLSSNVGQPARKLATHTGIIAHGQKAPSLV
jgi:hypothetical protein